MPKAVPTPQSLDQMLYHAVAAVARPQPPTRQYDLISFGGGSCPKIVGAHARSHGWREVCFLTNGSDNGGSTYKIVEALRPQYGPTLPVGDVTSALIGLLDPLQYELLNLRSWKLDPARFSEAEIHAFAGAIESQTSFAGRVDVTVDVFREKQRQLTPKRTKQDSERFYSAVSALGRWVDEVGLIRPGVPGMQLAEASIRHHLFNAVMIYAGAYDENRKRPDPGGFSVGLRLLQQALGIDYSVYPCSIDEQILYAEWRGPTGEIVWTTKRALPDVSVLRVGGQVALSNAPDRVKTLPSGEYARYGRFGFDPDLPQPQAYHEAVEAIHHLRPGQPMVFGPSSFVASIAPCLALPEIVAAIALRNDCPRILFLNLTLNSETVGWSVSDFVDFWELNTGRPVAETLDYVVANNDLNSSPAVHQALADKGDSLETFKFRGPLAATAAERRALPSRGIQLVEAPLAAVSRQLMRLSSEGERELVYVPSHNSARLMELCRRLAQDFSLWTQAKNAGLRGGDTPITLPLSDHAQAIVYRP